MLYKEILSALDHLEIRVDELQTKIERGNYFALYLNQQVIIKGRFKGKYRRMLLDILETNTYSVLPEYELQRQVLEQQDDHIANRSLISEFPVQVDWEQLKEHSEYSVLKQLCAK